MTMTRHDRHDYFKLYDGDNPVVSFRVRSPQTRALLRSLADAAGMPLGEWVVNELTARLVDDTRREL